MIEKGQEKEEKEVEEMEEEEEEDREGGRKEIKYFTSPVTV